MMERGLQLMGELTEHQKILIRRLHSPTEVFSAKSMQVNQSVVRALANHGFAYSSPLGNGNFLLSSKGRTVWEFLHRKPDPVLEAAERSAAQMIGFVVGTLPEPTTVEGGDDANYRTSYRPMCLDVGGFPTAAIDIRFNTTLTDMSKLGEIVDKLREIQEVLDRD